MTTGNSPSSYSPKRSLPDRLARRITQWRVAKPLLAQPSRPMVSFTFDDFPKSAADNGADIVESVGGRACFYACTGLAGTKNVTGTLFDETDISELSKAGHEIGAHTQTHLDCATASPQTSLKDIEHNITALGAMGLSQPPTQFAYPYGETRVDLKRELKDKFHAVRGILAGVNGHGSDLMQLRAMELGADSQTLQRALNAIESSARAPTWLIIFTHDVRSKPSSFGTTPSVLKQVAKAARDAGAAILTPSAALAEIQAGG